MRPKLGVDDRLLLFVFTLLICGCLVQPGSSGKTSKPKPGAAGIEALSRAATIEALHASADAIDAVADRVKAGEIKYDKPLQDAMGIAFQAGQDSESNKKLSATMKSAMDTDKETFDPVKVEKALRSLANGRRGIK